jgi:hypothetical protein
MKRSFLIIISIFLYFSCVAQAYSINENYSSMNFEIIKNDKIIYTLPFGRFCGYQKVNNNYFFIDCSKAKGILAHEYGEICYYDSKIDKLKYTGIFSGSSFLIIGDYNFLIATTLIESQTKSDIDNVFGITLNQRKYPLNISVYSLNNSTKIKEYSFIDQINESKLENLYIKFTLISKEEIKIDYGIYDSTYKLYCGIIKLKDLLSVY